MSLSNEAAYLYVYSKELLTLHKQLQRVSKKAEKFVRKYHEASTTEKKLKWKLKHERVMEDIKEIRKMHNHILTTIKRHQIAFAGLLQKQHTI